MGASLSARTEWRASSPAGSVPPSQQQQQQRLLAKGTQNEQLLYELLHVLERLCIEHTDETRKVHFKRPLVFPTALRAQQLQASSYGSNYIISNGSNGRGGIITSVEKSSDGKPLLHIEAVGERLFIARISNFEQLNILMQLAGENKVKEMHEAVQANPDFLANITGISGEPGAIMIEAQNQLQKTILGSDSNKEARESALKSLKLLLAINSYDLKILQGNLEKLASDKIINLQAVENELQLLASFAGRDPRSPLISIDWESDYVFANGYRAPPWRQAVGELCYLEIHLVDKEKIIVTASRNGFFINQGYTNNEKGSERMNYERASDIFPSLIALLRSYSPHFDETVDQQDYRFEPQLDTGTVITNSNKTISGENNASFSPESEEDADDEEGENPHKSKVENKKSEGKKKKSTVVEPKSRSTGQPSLKWRNLGGNAEEIAARKSSNAASILKEKKPKSIETKSSSNAKQHRHRGSIHDADQDSESESEVSSEEEIQEKRQENAELPAEYWQIQKLVKYLKGGNQTATIIAICSLRDFDLKNETNQLAIRDVGGLDTLVNLLDTEDPKCKMGALQILKEISQNVQIRRAISELEGMQPLVELLKDQHEDLKCLAAETIAHCAKNARNRRSVRRFGGIRKLVRLLKTKPGNVKNENVARSGALALWSCSKSMKNKEAIRSAGAIPLLGALLESTNENLLIPVVGILQECASEEQYRVAIRSSGMIKFLVENLASKNQELQTHCASAIFKCGEDEETRTLVRKFGGLDPLVNLLDNVGNKDLLIAATGAVWKCAQNLENVAAFNRLNTIKKLVSLMESQPEDVLVNVVGALGACAQTDEGRNSIRTNSGITPLVNLLTGTNQALLVNVTTAVGACALDPESMATIDRLDGVRLLWSLLKSPNPDVQASAAWAICPCIENAKDAGEMVRSFVGGLELIVSLLKSDNIEVLASVCAAIANIAKDEENLAVITDHGVVPMLAKLTTTRHDRLRKHLAEGIARCCHWGNNRVAFGGAGAVAPLVKYLKSPDPQVHRSTARALHQLSMDAENCVTMHEHGVVQLLLGMVGSSDEALQEAAAGCIGNIRRLALASEKATLG